MFRHSFPYQQNLQQIEHLEFVLQNKLFGLEKDLLRVDDVFKELDTYITDLLERYRSYQNLYLYEYLLRLRSRLSQVQKQYKYQKSNFNLLYFLIDKVKQGKEDFLNDILHGISQKEFSQKAFSKNESPRKIDMVKQKPQIRENFKYLSLIIGGLRVLVPYHRYRVLDLMDYPGLHRKKKITFVKKNNQIVYPLIHLFDFLDHSQNWVPENTAANISPLPVYSYGQRATKRELLVLLTWQNIFFGIFADSIGEKFSDHGYIRRNLQREQRLSLWQGKFVYKKQAYYLVDVFELVKNEHSRNKI